MKLTNLKKELRRFVGLILAVAIVISSVPPVYAEEVETGTGGAVFFRKTMKEYREAQHLKKSLQ
ncbi:hypothetical protein N752_21055 [Desulforamulus aquiferis]|nr:hypothetical protein [Desulforamulus aquiferis]RYD03323.1 hypothetical protein N752_21055 [Desulforamulus aquiferis]